MQSPIKNYPGAKTNSGILQWMVNHMPAHLHYYELFAGSAQLYYYKQPARISTLMDMDGKVIAAHKEAHATAGGHPLGPGQRAAAVRFFQGNTIDFLRSVQPLLDRSCFIYLDPPYPFDSRRNGKKYYKHEMSDDEHIQLLSVIRSMDCNIMLATKHNELYELYLNDWRKDTFDTIDRKGEYQEVIYMNYQQPTYLHQYDNLGGDCWQRQALKRKRTRFMDKIQALPPYERHMLIQELIQHDAPSVQHFLSILASPADNDCTISEIEAGGHPLGPGQRAALPESTAENNQPADQPDATVLPGATVGNDCMISHDTGITCHYCQQDAGLKPGREYVWNGFHDSDVNIKVCYQCRNLHYYLKQKTQHKGKYFEMPVVIPD